MKSSRPFLSMVALLLLPAGAWNQTAKDTHAATTNNDEAEIRALLDRWAKEFEAHDIDGIMSNDAPGDAVVAYDIAPPLQYKGNRPHSSQFGKRLMLPSQVRNRRCGAIPLKSTFRRVSRQFEWILNGSLS